jgi:hypothetical protein
MLRVQHQFAVDIDTSAAPPGHLGNDRIRALFVKQDVHGACTLHSESVDAGEPTFGGQSDAGEPKSSGDQS